MLFKKKPVNKLEQHQQASDAAFGIFQQTVNNLMTANAEIEKDIEQEEQAIALANANIKTMSAIKDKNAVLSNKVSEFFNI